jgi:CheY-like chemotaxis protein
MRVAARRGPLVQKSPLAGYSILVVEDEPFIAHCLQIVLRAAGAKVQSTADEREAWYATDQPKLSAGVLDCKHGIRGDHTIARRLAERGLPFVFYGAGESYRHAAWPNAPVMGKFTSGAEIVETLRGLLQPPQAGASAIVDLTGARVGAQAASTRTMAGVDALMKRRSVRRPHRQVPL